MLNFKKGDKVFLVQNWDRKGTACIQECIIDSCGKQQIHMRSVIDGKCLKHRFYTEHVNSEERSCGLNGAHIFSDDANIDVEAMKLAKRFLAWERQHLEGCLTHYKNAGEGYYKAIRDSITALHAPQVCFKH